MRKGWRNEPARHALAARGIRTVAGKSYTHTQKERKLRRMLDAKVVVVDEINTITLAWYGGHGIHAYDRFGNEIYFWNTGDFSKDNATKAEVLKSMLEAVRSELYFSDSESAYQWAEREIEYEDIKGELRGIER